MAELASPEFALTDEQDGAVQAILDILQGRSNRKSFSLGGLAGSGKTSVVKAALQRLENSYDEPAVVAFTGKAVSVLRNKGVSQARTLHSLIYHPHKDELTGKVTFTRVPELEVSSVLVDEASMISTDLYMDLMSYNVPVVFVGDHGQLEPVGDDPGLMRNPDLILKQIHRQAAGSPILDFAFAVREGKPYDWSQAREGLRLLTKKEATRDLTQYDQVLCGFNSTRLGLNALIRHQLGHREIIETGDRLVCARNNYEQGIFNGMVLWVTNVNRSHGGYHEVSLQTELGDALDDVQLYMPGGNKDFWMQPEEVVVADHGYALTTHKSQGSSWGNVLVVEEAYPAYWNQSRWSYTAATRAEKNLSWVKAEAR